MYPLRFEPIYQYRLWGGRRLAGLLKAPLPGDGPIGEAWLLSDRDDHPSRVADGPLKGRTIGQLMEQSPEQLLGKLAGRFRRFPVLLKFLDAHDKLSVQVHPKDRQTELYPNGRERQDRSMGRAGGGAGKPYLRGPEARHHARRSAAGTREPDGGGPAGQLHAATRRRRTSCQPGPFTRSAALWSSRCRKTAMSRFACTTGIASTPRQANLGLCKSNRRWPASISRKPRSVRWRRWWKRRRRCCASDSFIVHNSRCGGSAENRRSQSARRARRACWCASPVRESWSTMATNYPVGRGDVMLLPAEVGACSYRPRDAVSLLEVALPE